ncbi:MAG: hypothetical protein E2O40_00395 [Planctomycetota bacterium]|nr:MAG: hypothetical protein E2O40_00395 [Planctomycetota bacterium]
MDFLACGSFGDFAQSDNFIAVIAITFGSMMGLTGIIGGTIGGVMKTRAKEMTKRELAAYVAEGSLDADKAVMMLNAGTSRHDMRDLGKHV